MNLINELGTDLAVAILVEKRYRRKIDSHEALKLIGLVKSLLEPVEGRNDPLKPLHEDSLHTAAH